MDRKIRVTVWNEYVHEREDAAIKKVYPKGMHMAIAKALKLESDFTVRTATLQEPEHGLTDAVLAKTDVLLWWGHQHHHEVSEEVVKKVCRRVINGMGLIPLHSGHASRPFQRLLGTSTGSLWWREANDKERLWCIAPSHPIAAGLPPYFELPAEEMYGEYFDIPAPDELVFISWFTGGEVFRSGCCFNRGNGRIFYFRPGHESYPTYYDKNVIKVLTNAVRWAAPTPNMMPRQFGMRGVPIEPLD